MANKILQAEIGGIIQELLDDQEKTRGFLEAINKINMYRKSERLDSKTREYVSNAYLMICGGRSFDIAGIVGNLEQALKEDEKRLKPRLPR